MDIYETDVRGMLQRQHLARFRLSLQLFESRTIDAFFYLIGNDWESRYAAFMSGQKKFWSLKQGLVLHFPLDAERSVVLFCHYASVIDVASFVVSP